MAVSQWGRPDVPDFKQAAFTGRSESRISATDEKRERRSSCGGSCHLISSWNIRG